MQACIKILLGMLLFSHLVFAAPDIVAPPISPPVPSTITCPDPSIIKPGLIPSGWSVAAGSQPVSVPTNFISTGTFASQVYCSYIGNSPSSSFGLQSNYPTYLTPVGSAWGKQNGQPMCATNLPSCTYQVQSSLPAIPGDVCSNVPLSGKAKECHPVCHSYGGFSGQYTCTNASAAACASKCVCGCKDVGINKPTPVIP